MAEIYAMSVPQLAKIWGVSARKVYRLVENGDLGHMRIGAAIRIRQSDRSEYEARMSRAPEPPVVVATYHPPVVPPRGKLGPLTAFEKGQRLAAKARDGD